MSVRVRIGTGVVAVVVATGLAGCANGPAAHDAQAKAGTHPRSPSTTAPTTPTTSTSTTTTAPTAASGAGSPPAALRDGPGPQATYVVQPQPPAGSCRYTFVGSDPLPDAHCTPGALNPQVTQGTLASTICKSGYSSSIRPPESITGREKRGSALAYGYTGPFSTGEYDHLVSLELGGDPNDPANLWVEPNDNPNATTTANAKDVLEDRLHSLVCSGQLPLATAQEAIASNWAAAYQQYVGALPSSPPPGAAAPPSSATCMASATPANDGYSGDYYVSVTSNQPNQRATASDAGDTWSHDTDASGSVRILLYRTSAGEQIDVAVGAASCPTAAQ
jgi:hypothetical protein